MPALTIRERLATLPARKKIVREIVGPIQIGKRDRTVESAYLRLEPGSDKRIHTGISVATTSMRLASSETITEDGSTNLQNLVNKIRALDPLYDTRECMQADEGFVLVARDFAGAEMVLTFAYSKDWDWVERLIAGESAHGHHCVAAFDLPCKHYEVKKLHKNVYTTGKNLGFLSLYSGGARTATVTFNKDFPIHGQRTTEKEVQHFQQVLYDLHPLQEWWADVEIQIERDGGVIRNCFGYTRPLRDPDPHNRLKDALSLLPQSTVAWRMNESLCEVHDNLDREGEIELFHQVHDELILQAKPEHVQEALAYTKEVMERRFTIHGRELYIPTEAKVSEVGGSWGRMKEVKDL